MRCSASRNLILRLATGLSLGGFLLTPVMATASVMFAPSPTNQHVTPPPVSAREQAMGAVAVETSEGTQAVGAALLVVGPGQTWETEVILGALYLHVVSGRLEVYLDASDARVSSRTVDGIADALSDGDSHRLATGSKAMLKPGDSVATESGTVLVAVNDGSVEAVVDVFRKMPLPTPIAPELELPLPHPRQIMTPLRLTEPRWGSV